MDNEPQQPTVTPLEAPIKESQVSSMLQTKRNPMIVWVTAGMVILAGILLLYIFRSSIIPPKPAPPEVIIAPLPSPTPIRILSAIATQSAFMSLEQNASSVSSAIANTNLDDPSLMPPSIDLPLGFIQ